MYTNAEQDRDEARRFEEIQRQNGNNPRCPACNSEDVSRRHHHGNALAPECHWWECADCGHKSEPS